MDVRQLSQSELARRVGVSQATIYKLLIGESYGSKHLHRIARELLTSPAFLTGEIDDPEATALGMEVSSHDRKALEQLASLGKVERRAVSDILTALSRSAEAQLPDEQILTQVFEGLLATIDPSEPRAEQARLLARRLPIGLAQARRLRPDPRREDQPPASSVEAPATRHREPQQ
jgi:transcriptional regulator with XRE-family HTH domain